MHFSEFNQNHANSFLITSIFGNLPANRESYIERLLKKCQKSRFAERDSSIVSQ